MPIADARQIEVVVNGLPLWHGAQLAVDTTLVSPVGRDGFPRVRGDVLPGRAIEEATNKKRHDTYRELLAARRCRLVVLGVEVGGRWGDEAVDFLRRLARARVRALPPWLKVSATQGFIHRWSGLAAVAAQCALATSLLELPTGGEVHMDGDAPPIYDVLADARCTFPIADSRLPLR